MDGLSRVAGVGATLVLGGERLSVRALRVKDFAAIEAEVMSWLPHPFDAIRSAWQIHGNKPFIKQVCEIAVARCWGVLGITLDQYCQWRMTPAGRLMVLWMSLGRPQWKWFVDAVNDEISRDFTFLLKADEAILRANETDPWSLDETRSDKPYQWELLYRRLMDMGFSPDQIGEMTLNQINIAVCDENTLGDNLTMTSPAAARRFRERVEARQAEIVKQLMRECN